MAGAEVGRKAYVNVQLIDAATSAQIWAERFEGALDDLPALHDQVPAGLLRRFGWN
jgi:TolB-like protein